MAAHPKVDYARIEPGWRSGIKSVQQLAEEYTKETGISCSGVAIHRHFKSRGIPRNLNHKIQAAADAKVIAAMVNETTPKVNGMVNGVVNEPEIVDAGATAVAAIKIEHRGLAKKLRGVLAKLVAELESAPDELRAKINCAKQAAETLKTIVSIESEAWGFAKIPETPPADEDFDPIEVARRMAFVLARARHEMQEANPTIQ